jgi:heat-inducible transcriptional repressor
MITQREKNILEAIVGEYISTAMPVASGTVAQRHGLGVSPATVRHEMANLEDEGYIHRTHSSAGSVPSDKGYRHYVESLPDITEPSAEIRGLLQQKFQSANPDIEVWTRLAAMALSEVVRNLVIVSPPRLPQARLRHIELVYLQEFVVLLVLVLHETKLRQQLVYLETPLSHGDAIQVANKLNYHFAGLTGEAIRNSNDDLSPIEGKVTKAALHLLGATDKEAYIEYHSDGLRHILGQPELMESSRAYTVAAILENGSLVRTLLGATPRNGIRVIIGEENIENALHPFSIVLCSYGLPEGAVGTILALGPTRMEYPRTITTANYMSGLMTQLLASVYG